MIRSSQVDLAVSAAVFPHTVLAVRDLADQASVDPFLVPHLETAAAACKCCDYL